MAFFLASSILLLLALFGLPLVAGDFWAYQLTLYYIYAIAALGVGLAWGQAGILSLGQGLFVAIAAYLAGYSLIYAPFGFAAYAGIVLAVMIGSVVAFIIAILVFRGRTESGPSFSLLTLALALCGYQIAGSWSSVTGGFNGLSNVPALPGFGGFLDLYYISASMLVLCMSFVSWLFRAPIGTIWRAISENERRLGYFGYNTARLKSVAFMISALLAGIAGGLYAPQQNLVTPDLAGFNFSGDLVVFAAIGGRSTAFGPVIGSVLVGALSSELRDRFPWWEIVIGLLFILVVLRMPGGIVGFLSTLLPRHRRKAGTAEVVKAAKRIVAKPADIAMNKIHCSVGEVQILDGLDFSTTDEKFVCVIGPNGAGKTSTLNVLTGALAKQSGDIHIDGILIANPTPAAIARRGVARKFQTPSLFPKLSLRENLCIALWTDRIGFWDLLNPAAHGWTTPVMLELRQRFPFLLNDHVLASSLSHGERQILELVMALLTEPRLLLLDEPCAGLSHQETAQVVDTILWAQTELGFRVIVIEHDMELVRRIADRVIVLHQGKFLAGGTVAAIQANPTVRAVYLGDSR